MRTLLALLVLASGGVYVSQGYSAAPSAGPTAPPCRFVGALWVDTSDTPALKVCTDDSPATWSDVGGGESESVPSGSILLIASGACPTGYSEVAALNGKTPVGTLAANANIGTTGGADSITPAGSVAAPTFTGTPFSDVIAHTHTIASQTATTGGASSWEHGAIDASSAAAETLPTGSTGGVASITPAGANSAPAFTGTQFDNRSAFVRVIYCAKT